MALAKNILDVFWGLLSGWTLWSVGLSYRSTGKCSCSWLIFNSPFLVSTHMLNPSWLELVLELDWWSNSLLPFLVSLWMDSPGGWWRFEEGVVLKVSEHSWSRNCWWCCRIYWIWAFYWSVLVVSYFWGTFWEKCYDFIFHKNHRLTTVFVNIFWIKNCKIDIIDKTNTIKRTL